MINKKEIFLGSALFSILGGFTQLTTQIGVFYPNYFYIFINITYALAALGFLAYTYYWEKNLVDLKKVPTIINGVAFILCLINIFSNILTLVLALIIQVLLLMSCFFLIFLVAQFTKNVKGNLRKNGFLLLFSFVLMFAAITTDHDPLIMMAPELFIILSPILFIIMVFFTYFATIGICEGITSYYNQEHICTIHRGTIPKGKHIYYCSSCNTIYCQKCYEQVIKRDGCWNCGKGGKNEPEIRFREETIDEGLIMDDESKDKLK